MKLIIAGTRTFNDYALLKESMKGFIFALTVGNFKPECIISGCALGADRLGERFAKEFDIPIVKIPADWNTYGKSAGPIRNEEMAKQATHCIIFWDGNSKGSKNMIEQCKKYNIPCTVIKY